MAAETYGTKGNPQFSASGAPQVDVDPQQAGEYAAVVGNNIVGTTAQRTANVVPNGSGKAVWTGLRWFDSSLNAVFEYIGGWVRRQVMRVGRARLTTATVVTAASPSWMDILTVTADSTGGICMIDVAANVYNPNSGGVRTAGLRVVCDGTQVDDIWQLDIPNPGGASAGVHGVVRAESTPGVGTHTWKFQANASAASSVSIRSAVMTVQEV